MSARHALPTTATRLSAVLPRAGWDPAQRAALWLGAWFVVNGAGAFAVDAAFTAGSGGGNLHGWLRLTLRVNGWHALFHLIPGVAGIAVAAHPMAARRWVWAVAGLYLAAGVSGLIDGQSAFGWISVERFGSVVHLIEAGAAGWAAIHASHLVPLRWRRAEYAVAAAVFGVLLAGAVICVITGHVVAMCCCGSCT